MPAWRTQTLLTAKMSYVLQQEGNEGLSKDIPIKVHVIAPSTLPEGYIVDAEVGVPGAKMVFQASMRPKPGLPQWQKQPRLVPL